MNRHMWFKILKPLKHMWHSVDVANHHPLTIKNVKKFEAHQSLLPKRKLKIKNNKTKTMLMNSARTGDKRSKVELTKNVKSPEKRIFDDNLDSIATPKLVSPSEQSGAALPAKTDRQQVDKNFKLIKKRSYLENEFTK